MVARRFVSIERATPLNGEVLSAVVSFLTKEAPLSPCTEIELSGLVQGVLSEVSSYSRGSLNVVAFLEVCRRVGHEFSPASSSSFGPSKAKIIVRHTLDGSSPYGSIETLSEPSVKSRKDLLRCLAYLCAVVCIRSADALQSLVTVLSAVKALLEVQLTEKELEAVILVAWGRLLFLQNGPTSGLSSLLLVDACAESVEEKLQTLLSPNGPFSPVEKTEMGTGTGLPLAFHVVKAAVSGGGGGSGGLRVRSPPRVSSQAGSLLFSAEEKRERETPSRIASLATTTSAKQAATSSSSSSKQLPCSTVSCRLPDSSEVLLSAALARTDLSPASPLWNSVETVQTAQAEEEGGRKGEGTVSASPSSGSLLGRSAYQWTVQLDSAALEQFARQVGGSAGEVVLCVSEWMEARPALRGRDGRLHDHLGRDGFVREGVKTIVSGRSLIPVFVGGDAESRHREAWQSPQSLLLKAPRDAVVLRSDTNSMVLLLEKADQTDEKVCVLLENVSPLSSIQKGSRMSAGDAVATASLWCGGSGGSPFDFEVSVSAWLHRVPFPASRSSLVSAELLPIWRDLFIDPLPLIQAGSQGVDTFQGSSAAPTATVAPSSPSPPHSPAVSNSAKGSEVSAETITTREGGEGSEDISATGGGVRFRGAQSLLFGRKMRTPSELQEARKRVVGPNCSLFYRQRPLKIVRGVQEFLMDEGGRLFLDCINNVAHVGHGHPLVVQAGQAQMGVLNTNARFLHDGLVAYAERLCSLLPEGLDVAFLTCTGSEANELALRLARAYTGREDLVVLEGCYHGNTSALVNVCAYEKYGQTAAPWSHPVVCPDPYRGPFTYENSDAGEKYAGLVKDKIEEVEKKGRGVAAFLAESVMSCGGQVFYPQGFLKTAFEHARAAGALAIADEVQTGFGRTGSPFWWAFEEQGAVPDIVTMGKPIGNGHPLSAVVTTREVADAFRKGEYFNTFGGNPVSCAVGLAVIQAVELGGLRERAGEVGAYLVKRLQGLMADFPLLGDVRGRGLFVGIELVRDRVTKEPAKEEASYLALRLRELGILVSTDGPHGNVLKLKPPMTFCGASADGLVAAFEGALREDCLSEEAVAQRRTKESERKEQAAKEHLASAMWIERALQSGAACLVSAWQGLARRPLLVGALGALVGVAASRLAQRVR
uniref:Uncharacterized protein n=1 Tax=Chromera velia CCMP2878 TaxID=1169474 RepID=A0A0G4FMD3_9ALVE|eukprot:Cvel_17760.t1-p1 / transcript=Cvel_17760.t1 / gene=Cvel_17760 / organism=Chromera_velia_CCMP2878 / gene_product=Ethanolamine-phosphate phospho-lyase, putative / transcript_product=Ethanolamine-phosphate phospho-lyase, putative / location=Cvel_scaffold1436:5779-11302(+) / protein_length=1161 / sequence_SO=supercontig / SO=protein_coding / is_pseudo=false